MSVQEALADRVTTLSLGKWWKGVRASLDSYCQGVCVRLDYPKGMKPRWDPHGKGGDYYYVELLETDGGDLRVNFWLQEPYRNNPMGYRVLDPTEPRFLGRFDDLIRDIL